MLIYIAVWSPADFVQDHTGSGVHYFHHHRDCASVSRICWQLNGTGMLLPSYSSSHVYIIFTFNILTFCIFPNILLKAIGSIWDTINKSPHSIGRVMVYIIILLE